MSTQATTIELLEARYAVSNLGEIPSPSLLIFRELMEQNLDWMVRIAGGPDALRPHVKTHKTREIVRIWLERGVTRHKCATIAEAEMLAEENVHDIFIAYQMVGPNIQRLLRLVDTFSGTRFAT